MLLIGVHATLRLPTLSHGVLPAMYNCREQVLRRVRRSHRLPSAISRWHNKGWSNRIITSNLSKTDGNIRHDHLSFVADNGFHSHPSAVRDRCCIIGTVLPVRRSLTSNGKRLNGRSRNTTDGAATSRCPGSSLYLRTQQKRNSAGMIWGHVEPAEVLRGWTRNGEGIWIW